MLACEVKRKEWKVAMRSHLARLKTSPRRESAGFADDGPDQARRAGCDPNIKLRPPLLRARPETMLASRMGPAVSCRADAR